MRNSVFSDKKSSQMNKNALDCYFEKESLVRTKQEGRDLIKNCCWDVLALQGCCRDDWHVRKRIINAWTSDGKLKAAK